MLIPEFSFGSNNGLELAVPYHWQFAPNRDLTLTPHVYSGALPAIEARYRELNRIGAFQVGGFVTYGKREDSDLTDSDAGDGRGHSRLLRRQWQGAVQSAVEPDRRLPRRHRQDRHPPI